MGDIDGLTVSVRTTDDGQFYRFGVTVNGYFCAFAEVPVSNLDARIAEAAAAAPVVATPPVPVATPQPAQ